MSGQIVSGRSTELDLVVRDLNLGVKGGLGRE